VFGRAAAFIGLQGLGALGGVLAWPDRPVVGALVGVLAAGGVWILVDLSRSARALTWLRQGGALDASMTAKGVWGDVVERMRRLLRTKEQMIQASQARLHDFLAALQASPNGVVLLDAQSQIEWFNQTAAAHFGLETQRDLRQHFGNLVRDPAFAAYLASRDYGCEVRMPGRMATALRPINLSVQLHPYGEGRLLLLSRDVTLLEQAEAMRRDFVANVSHEIRTPLTVLSGFVETLQTLPLTPQEHDRYLAMMSVQAQRMQTLVSDLLMLSRLEGSPPPGLTEWIAVPAVMSQLQQDALALSATFSGGAHPAHVLIFEGPEAIELAGITSEILSATSNLVSNAIRYTPVNGSIRVRAGVLPDGGLEFSVTDSGPGIAPEHIPRLTERFYRVDRSRSRDTGGTGLGLAIVKHVAQRHGGHLRIHSVPGQGATFTLSFPSNRIRST
jgi:two-component system phosphate regulon sensor histidine kinase PhoR